MTELLTTEGMRALLRIEVAEAGGAKKWLRARKVFGHDHIMHMVNDGSAATLDSIARALGYEKVTMFRKVEKP